MNKKSRNLVEPPSQSALKYRCENCPWVRGLTSILIFSFSLYLYKMLAEKNSICNYWVSQKILHIFLYIQYFHNNNNNNNNNCVSFAGWYRTLFRTGGCTMEDATNEPNQLWAVPFGQFYGIWVDYVYYQFWPYVTSLQGFSEGCCDDLTRL